VFFSVKMLTVSFDYQGIYSLRRRDGADQRAESSAEKIMNALDRNNDGQLSAREFITAASEHPDIVAIIDGKSV